MAQSPHSRLCAYPIETINLVICNKAFWTDAKRGPALIFLQFPEFSHVSYRVFYIHIIPTSNTSLYGIAMEQWWYWKENTTVKEYEIYLAAKDTETYPYGDSSTKQKTI